MVSQQLLPSLTLQQQHNYKQLRAITASIITVSITKQLYVQQISTKKNNKIKIQTKVPTGYL